MTKINKVLATILQARAFARTRVSAHTLTWYGQRPSGPTECWNAEITKGVPDHTREVRQPLINISHDKDLTNITSQVVEVEAAGEDTKDTKEVATPPGCP